MLETVFKFSKFSKSFCDSYNQKIKIITAVEMESLFFAPMP